jgi:hypothetical protein
MTRKNDFTSVVRTTPVIMESLSKAAKERGISRNSLINSILKIYANEVLPDKNFDYSKDEISKIPVL